jgi:hypothetical protein
MHDDTADCRLSVRRQRSRMRIPEADEPRRNRWWREEWDLARKSVERFERKVVGVCVRQQDRVQPWKVTKRDARFAHPREKPSEGVIEVRISQ